MLSVWSPASGQQTGRETELEEIRDQIAVLRSRLNQVRQEATGLRGELTQTELALELQEKRLEEARRAREVAEESLLELQADIENLEIRLEELHVQLRDRLIDLHRLGQQGYLRLFLSIQSEEDLLPGIRQVRYFAKRDGGLLESYLEAQAGMKFKREELSQHGAAVQQWMEIEAQRMQQLDALHQQQARLLKELEQQDRSLSQRSAALVDKERKLANLIDFLYGRSGSPLSGTPAQSFRGVLDWPVSGRVVQGFGTRLDPRYKTRIPHNGIELATPARSEVRVVFPGKVLFAAPFQGYGLTAIIHHPGRVFTLYAGLEKLNVGQNDMLSLGEMIGLSSESLYFEIRENNQPVNPLEWLR